MRTRDGVTDDDQNYLARKTDEFAEFSHIYPEIYKQAQAEKAKKKVRSSHRNMAAAIATAKAEAAALQPDQQKER